MNDSFVHNSRSELASATVNGSNYGYDYDNIGNRRLAIEASDYTLYEANELNQYTSIQENGKAAFVPDFDTDGNQNLVKTATGIWSVHYNAENRPIRFTNADGSTVIECSYDYMGRRATKKVTTNGSITLHQRYIYCGYLQIAACDLTRSGHPCLWLLTWDPTQPIVSRPLAIRKDGTWYAYGWDITKNICEVFGPAGHIRAAYTYNSYGKANASGDVSQSIQWSSEYHDDETALIYYNYRHYNPVDGRWLGRDRMFALNSFLFAHNAPIGHYDVLGDISTSYSGAAAGGHSIGDLPELLYDIGRTSEELTETMAQYLGKNIDKALPMAVALIMELIESISWPCENSTKDEIGRAKCEECCKTAESMHVGIVIISFYWSLAKESLTALILLLCETKLLKSAFSKNNSYEKCVEKCNVCQEKI